MAVGGRFAGTKQVEVGAVEDQDRTGHAVALLLESGLVEMGESRFSAKMYRLVNFVNRMQGRIGQFVLGNLSKPCGMRVSGVLAANESVR
ncbi:hypothetical protein D9M71_518640 [compost metagenome]